MKLITEKADSSRETLRVGSLAYYDTFAGLVPCKVLSLKEETKDPSVPMSYELALGGIPSRYKATVRITATRGAYRKGEILMDLFAHDVVPRKAVRFLKYSPRIGAYNVDCGL